MGGNQPIGANGPMDEGELSAAWRDYAADREGRADLRARLAGHYRPLVRDEAERMVHGLPSCVDARDVVCAGHFGLLEAVARFDPARDARFEAFGRRHIRRAVLDDLRRR